MNLPSKTHALFFDNPHLLNLQTAQAPLFGQFLYVLVFRETPSLKISFLANPHNINYLMKKNKFHLFHKVIRNFSSWTSSHLLKATKFLVKFPSLNSSLWQKKFFFVYKFYRSYFIFYVKTVTPPRPPLKKVTPSFPTTSL